MKSKKIVTYDNRKHRRSLLARLKSKKRNELTKGAFGQPHNDILREYNIHVNELNKQKREKKDEI
jgi:hypothetical protein